MRRGTICWINLEPGSPPEFGKTRPALIVSNSSQNFTLKSVVVLPLSTQPPEIWPLRLKISLPKGKTSFVVLPGIRQASKGRILEVIGMASAQDMARVTEALKLYLRD